MIYIYVYDATGVKQQKIVSTGTTTDYAGNYVYENNLLQFFNQPEGYVEPNGSLWNYVYQYKDHLGNIRLSYSDKNNNGVILVSTDPNTNELVEENNYYPFGLKHKGYNNVQVGRDHKFGFGNKEEQDELGLGWIDITARNYDAALGRFMNVDPLAEQAPDWTPYRFCFNNPLRYTDPTGMFEDDYITKQDGTIEVTKTDDKFDRFLVENKNGKTEEVYRVDKPNTDKQSLVKFPDEGKGFTRYGNKDAGGDHYVKPEIAAALFGAVNKFAEKNPDVKIQFGDMSNSSGQRPNASHSTHSGGRNVDFRYIRTDGAMKPVDVNSSVFDVTRSQDLINAFGKFGFNGPKSIGSFPNNNGVLLEGTFKLGGHGDHGHLQNFNLRKK